jgi:murein L,D-transpeptidase YafK
LTPNSTNGCIVLDNRDVAELSQYIRLRQTPVIIEEKILSIPLQELKQEREQFYEILSEWKRSWETKQLDRYMSFYSPSFRSKGMDWQSWRAYKDHLNQEYSTIQITIDPPILLKHNRNVIAVFFQCYRSDRFFNEGTKRLYFTLEGGEWKIIGEEWDVHRAGDVPPPISEKILAAYPYSKANPPEPATASPSPPEEKLDRDLAPNFQEIQDFLTTWKESWETKNLDRFMDCYSKAFRTQGKGWDQWREHKNHLNELYREIQVSLEEVKMQKKDGQILVSFRQSYRSDGFKSTGQKSLILRQEENSWKIIRESFRRFK